MADPLPFYSTLLRASNGNCAARAAITAVTDQVNSLTKRMNAPHSAAVTAHVKIDWDGRKEVKGFGTFVQIEDRHVTVKGLFYSASIDRQHT